MRTQGPAVATTHMSVHMVVHHTNLRTKYARVESLRLGVDLTSKRIPLGSAASKISREI